MIFSTRAFGREFLYPQLHHVMDCGLPHRSLTPGHPNGRLPPHRRGHQPKMSTPNMTGRRFHCTMEMIPARPWLGSLKALLFPPLLNKVQNKRNARGTSEVRRGTSSNHFHCPVPRSSGHIGHGKWETFFLPLLVPTRQGRSTGKKQYR